jgi:hypothetical protein
MLVHNLFLDQWNNNCKKARKFERLMEIGVLVEDYTSKWASLIPTFANHKEN